MPSVFTSPPEQTEQNEPVHDRSEFESVLFASPVDLGELEATQPPEYFVDLALDQIVGDILKGREWYALAPYFAVPARSLDEVTYRHEVFRDLEKPEIREAVDAFVAGMRETRLRQELAAKMRIREQRSAWTAAAIRVYLDAVTGLRQRLEASGSESRALAGALGLLVELSSAAAFAELAAQLERTESALGEISYCIEIEQARVRVSPYEGEHDLSRQVLETFARFRRRAFVGESVTVNETADMDHIEAQILARVEHLFPEPFARLSELFRIGEGFLDPRVARLDRELQFYLGVLDYLAPLRGVGVSICLPQMSLGSSLLAEDAVDVALATSLLRNDGRAVPNSFRLAPGQRCFVVTGPNQGGKTTFARAFGQLHHLGALGCPVAASSATLRFFDSLCVQFERVEELGNLRGKLEDDLVRIRGILEQATEGSVILLNEIFTSTSMEDALLLGRRVLERIVELGAVCVCVTFLDELSTIDDSIVSMVSAVDPEDVSVRTFKVERRPADGRSYAAAIAAKYGLGHTELRRTLQQNPNEQLGGQL